LRGFWSGNSAEKREKKRREKIKGKMKPEKSNQKEKTF
jgi:hypothetical protein